MAEFLSPGIFIEEVPAAQTIDAVSTSTMATVGFTVQGPTDKATLVTSSAQFQKIFGGNTKNSLIPLTMTAFFANGGRRAYVVRVVPLDAVAAQAKVESQTTNQQIETGDGVVVAFTKSAGASLLKDNAGASPLVGTSVSIRWRAPGVLVSGQAVDKRDGVAALTTSLGVLKYEGRINPTSLPALDSSLYAVVPKLTTDLLANRTKIMWLSATVTQTIEITYPTAGAASNPITTNTNVAGSSVTFDHRTGRFSLSIAVAETPDAAGAVTMDFTPAAATSTITDLAGTLVGVALTAPGTIGYADGSYSFTTTGPATPHLGTPLLATYQIKAWTVNPISKGTWANGVRLVVSGSQNFFDPLTASYSRFNVAVQTLDAVTSTYLTQETYDELDFSDPNSAVFFPDVMNELSDFVRIDEPGGNEAPGQLVGVPKVLVVATGDESVNNQTIATSLVTGNAASNANIALPGGTIAKRSVVITYKNTLGVVQTITDDGKGNLIGAVDATYVGSITVGPETLVGNKIGYTTGNFNFRTSVLIQVGSLVTVSYRLLAAETSHAENLGDATKGYTVGTDGTFDSTQFGRGVFTDPSLTGAGSGLYALNRVDEILQVIVPDFAGDVTVSGDLLDYAATRASQPSGGDRFIILTVPKGSSPQDAVDWLRFSLKRYSSYAALYWPWVRMADPLANGRPLTVPPLGHIAGIYARTDNNKNVSKAPGGTIDGALQSLIELEYSSTQGERDLVYPNKINALIDSAQTGLAVWGVRTISADSAFKYIQVRRLFMFLEKSIFNATHWAVFENNDANLWTRLKGQLGSFLGNLYNQGYFRGTSPANAFRVKVDETNNTPASIDAGQVFVEIAVAPTRPGEFIVFKLAQLSTS